MTGRDPSAVLQPPELTSGAQRILDAASRLFYRQGIHAVGVDTIAAESGVTKRTLYDRFGSKDKLVAVYLQARHQRWWRRLEQRVLEHPDAPVLALFDSYVDDFESSDRGCAFRNAAAELPADHLAYPVIRAHKQAVLDRLTELVDTGSAAHRKDALRLAQEFYLLLEGAIALRGISGDDQLLRRARELVQRRVDDYAASIESRPGNLF